ncbi:asparagine synthase (glutamine-hydrolyzing), partial [Candidatus Parcubacteria bacterium]
HSPALFLARDRLGIKPLYYNILGDRLIFASEIKAILLAEGVRREVNLEALHRYLAFLWVPGPETMFKGVYKLPPAHYMLWWDGGYSIHPYWDLRFDVNGRADERELVEELRGILTSAVERHLISDVPLGVFLSGGLDSSTILALAAQVIGEPVTAYTIAYRPEDARLEQFPDEARFARLVAQHFGAEYHEIVVEPKVVDLFPKVVWHLDEPVADAAAIATYLICEAARPQLKVLLSGQGGDEVFAGYRVHWTHRLANLVRLLPEPLRNGPARALLGMLPALKDYVPGVHPGLMLAVHRYFDKLLQGAALSPEQRYVFYRSYYTDGDQLQLYTPELRTALTDTVAGARHLAYFEAVRDADFLNRMLYVDVKTFLPELNLTYSDKLSSATSVEVRVPLLDLELVEFMARVPPGLKLKGLTNSKYLLKKAMEGILPDPVIRRRKAGFGAPLRAWLRRDLREMVDDLLSEEAIKRRGYFDPKTIRRLIENDREGVEDNAQRIWAFLTLELWHRTFIDGAFP